MPRRTVVATAALLIPLVGAAAPSPEQSTLMRELHRCLGDISSDAMRRASTCVRKNADVLVGVLRTELVAGLGDPRFCITAHDEFLPWRSPDCRGRLGIGYSFYRLCRDCVGGGPELIFAFDSEDRVKSAHWTMTQ